MSRSTVFFRDSSMLLAGTVIAIGVLNGQDNCSDLLKDGVFNTWRATSKYASDSAYHQALCSGVVLQTGKYSQSNAGLSYGDLDMDLHMNYGAASSYQSYYRQTYCSSNSGRVSTTSDSDVLRSTVDPNVVAAFTECIRLKGTGLDARVEQGPDYSLLFRMRFQSQFEGITPSVRLVNVSNGNCTGDFGVGSSITRDSFAMKCSQVDSGQWTNVLVSTTAGAIVGYLPPRGAPSGLINGIIQTSTFPIKSDITNISTDNKWSDVNLGTFSVTPRYPNSKIVVSLDTSIQLEASSSGDPHIWGGLRVVTGDNRIVASKSVLYNNLRTTVRNGMHLEGEYAPGSTQPVTFKVKAYTRSGSRLHLLNSCADTADTGDLGVCAGAGMFVASEVGQ